LFVTRFTYNDFATLRSFNWLKPSKGLKEAIIKIITMFSRTEVIHITISVITISLAFSLPFFLSFPVVFLTVGLGFLLHELGHKFVAIKLGCVAVYRAWMEGLVIALIFAFATAGRFVFAAPGAVYIYKKGGLTLREDGLISIAGPLVNVLLAFFFLWFFIGTKLIEIGMWGFRINMFLGAFNMLPIPPLDGSKVIRWNKAAWGLVFFIALIGSFIPL